MKIKIYFLLFAFVISYSSAQGNPGLSDLREVLCPSDQVSEEGEFLSDYIIPYPYTLTIEPNVTIMDANFKKSGSGGAIQYYPDQTYGNFKISPDLKLIWLSEEVVVEDPDEIWVNEIEFMGDRIIVENGAKLTITNTLTMQPEGKIIVKRGGQLIIDGATITGNDTWAGIDVWGTADQPQNLIHQGLVRIIDNGTIEQADIGIRTIKTIIDETDGEILDLHYTGGIVLATNSNFVNNRIAVVFYDYAINSISGFNGCSFITNDNYNGQSDPAYFVILKSMRGIDFLNCSFRNNSNNVCFGSGIYSFNSGFAVGHPEADIGEFVNLYRGIYAIAGGTVNFPQVYHINFENNYRGVYFSAMDHGEIKNNDFTTGPSIDGASYGIYLDRSTGYTIEENEFYQGSSDGIGIVVNNSDPEPNRIYNNYFEEMYFGIIAQQHNRADDGTGLVLKCNEYNNNTFDQVVTWEGPKIDGKAGIAAAQGADLPQPDAPAGNLFSWNGTTDFSDFYNEANIITYYYHVDPDYHLQPQYYSESVEINPVDGALWNDDSCPPSDQGGGGGGSGDTEEMKSLITLSGQKADSVNAIIEVLKDGGSTEALKWEVDMSTPPETYTVYNELMNNSPYISDTVMESAIEKEEVLPNVMIRDVMVANPHNAKDESLLEKIGERSDPMP